MNEFATPSMGTAGAGAQAWADDAATAWHNAAGMTRIDGNEVTLGAGIGSIDAEFDTDPGTPVSSSDRTADMPVDEQFRFAMGAQHQLSETLAVGGSFVYADLGDARINNPTTLEGDYETNRALFFALILNWKF